MKIINTSIALLLLTGAIAYAQSPETPVMEEEVIDINDIINAVNAANTPAPVNIAEQPDSVETEPSRPSESRTMKEILIVNGDDDPETVIANLKREQDRLYRLKNDPKRQGNRNPKWAVSLNIADGFTFGTMGLTGQLVLSRNVTLDVKVRYNPWTWNLKDTRQMQYRNQTYSVGARWWPWYTYSGMWVSGALQYQQYNRAGIGVEYAREGDAYGAAFNGGYAVQICPWFNVDFGLGFFAGYHKYHKYACPVCGKLLESGDGFFILPDFVTISAMFVF